MALSTTSKRGLALTALLPVLLSVYSEYRKDAETQAQQQAARIELQRQRREAEQARDLENAQKMLGWITSDVADPDDTRHDGGFCEHLFMASELVRATTISNATRQALASALEYRREASGANSPPLVCTCPNTLSLMRTSWAPTRRSTAPLPVVAEMTELLARSAALCAPEPVLAALGPGEAGEGGEAMPAPVAAPAPVGEAPPEAGRGGPHPPPPPPREQPPARPPRGGAEPVPPPPPPPPAEREAEVCADPAAGARMLGPPAEQPVTVYIQIAVEAQRPAAQRLLRRLQAAGYSAPGIERVGLERAPGSGELRYVYAADADAAGRLLADTQAACAGPALFGHAPKLLAQLRGRALPRTFELWFARPPLAAAGAPP